MQRLAWVQPRRDDAQLGRLGPEPVTAVDAAGVRGLSCGRHGGGRVVACRRSLVAARVAEQVFGARGVEGQAGGTGRARTGQQAQASDALRCNSEQGSQMRGRGPGGECVRRAVAPTGRVGTRRRQRWGVMRWSGRMSTSTRQRRQRTRGRGRCANLRRCSMAGRAISSECVCMSVHIVCGWAGAGLPGDCARVFIMGEVGRARASGAQRFR